MFLIRMFNQFLEAVDVRSSAWLVPTLARLVFAGVLLVYFWRSAAVKLGDGLFGFINPTPGAYVQVFPKAMEAVGYDQSQLSILHTLVVIAGTWGELLLPLLIIVGFLTRLAALGMIAFVVVQSIVDIYGHGVGGKDLGTWFDSTSGSLILDQRSFWMFLFLIILLKGAGPISLDRFLPAIGGVGRSN